MLHSKRYRAITENITITEMLGLREAVEMVKRNAQAKFDETVELVANLGIDPKKADQQVRGTVSLPHGTGKNVRVVVFAQGELATEAEEAGADRVGGEELAAEVQKGWLDFDIAIAAPDMMRHVGKLGRVLGPRGMMPNPKTGTVTKDIGKAVTEFKAGKIEYRADKGSGIHVPVGRASFDVDSLVDNLMTVMDALIKARPTSSKGTYLKSLYLCTTMSPSVRLDPGRVRDAVRGVAA